MNQEAVRLPTIFEEAESSSSTSIKKEIEHSIKVCMLLIPAFSQNLTVTRRTYCAFFGSSYSNECRLWSRPRRSSYQNVSLTLLHMQPYIP